MRRAWIFSAVLACAALHVAACGSSSGGTNNGGGDTTADAGGDGDASGGGDTSSDVTTDTAPGDTTADTTTDPTPDVVADTGPDLPDLGEACTESSCEAPQACVGGGCVSPVDNIDDYATAAEANPASYWDILQLPSLFNPPESCCFDYNGDGRPDDGLGGLLGVLNTFLSGGSNPVDIQGTLDASIADGTITLVNEWRELPAGDGDVKFSIFLGSNDVNQDSTLDNTPEERAAGMGSYLLDPASFGDYGSQVQFNLGTRASDTIYAGPSQFHLSLNIAALGDTPFDFTLVDARVLAPITVEDDGVHTVDEQRGSGEEAFTVGGGELGGVLDAGQLIGFLDGQFRNCSCAGINPDQPVLTYSVDVEQGQVVVSCTDNTGDGGSGCGSGDSALCSNISTVCGFVGLIGQVLDVDLDNDGINESLSAALRFGWTGATIAGLIPPPAMK